MADSSATYLNASSDAPTLYVDGYDGVVLGSGIVRLRLFEDKWNSETGRFDRQFVQTIVMSHENFQDIVTKLVIVAAGFGKAVIDGNEVIETKSDG